MHAMCTGTAQARQYLVKRRPSPLQLWYSTALHTSVLRWTALAILISSIRLADEASLHDSAQLYLEQSSLLSASAPIRRARGERVHYRCFVLFCCSCFCFWQVWSFLFWVIPPGRGSDSVVCTGQWQRETTKLW